MPCLSNMNRGLIVFISIAVIPCIVSGIKTKAHLINKISPDGFSVILLPDTQYYTKRDPEIYYRQTKWIVDQRDNLNIKFVIHLGDITHDNTDKQWNIADTAHGILEKANIAYSTVPGNHDMTRIGTGNDRKRDTTKYNQYFGPDRFSDKRWYGGHMGAANDNNFSFFEWGNLKFLVVGLEFAPRDEALEWADKIIQRYKERRVIVVTHCYLNMCKAGNTGCGRYHNECASHYNVDGNGADTIWEKLIRRHNNIFMVLSGHVADVEHVARKGDAGNAVHELLTDYQREKKAYYDKNGELKKKDSGNGWLRVLQFCPNENKVYIGSHSVEGVGRFFLTERYNKNPAHPDHTFSFHYNLNTAVP